MMLSKGKRWLWLVALPLYGAATFEELAERAAAARAADRIPEAIELYQQALHLKADWVEGWWYVGTLYYDSDRYADGQRAFGEFVKLADKPPGWAFLGLCEFETGEYAPAEEHLKKALDAGLAPDIDQVARFHQALLFTRLGLFDQAWHYYRPLAARGIHDPALINGMGLNALSKAMLPKEAPIDQQEMIAAAGKAAYAWLAGDNAQAEKAFRALLAADPATPGVHNLYATYLLGVRPDDAMPELQRELELNPQCAEARATMALLLLKAGQVSDASSMAKKAVEDRPTSPLAQYAYALTLADDRQATEHLEIAARLDPSNFEYHMELARIYSKSGRHAEARRERKISLQLARESAPGGRS